MDFTFYSKQSDETKQKSDENNEGKNWTAEFIKFKIVKKWPLKWSVSQRTVSSPSKVSTSIRKCSSKKAKNSFLSKMFQAKYLWSSKLLRPAKYSGSWSKVGPRLSKGKIENFDVALFTHCSKSSFFCPKIQLWFPEKIVDFLGGWKTREIVVVFDFLAVDSLDFTRKIVKTNLDEKLVKMLRFCQNWIFGQKFDF